MTWVGAWELRFGCVVYRMEGFGEARWRIWVAGGKEEGMVEEGGGEEWRGGEGRRTGVNMGEKEEDGG